MSDEFTPHIVNAGYQKWEAEDIPELPSGKLPRKLKKRLKKERDKIRGLKFISYIRKIFIDDFNEQAKYIQAFPEFWKEVADESAKNFPTIQYVPPTDDQQNAMEEMQRKWDQRLLERELKEYEKLDQYFKEHGVK